LIGRKIQNKKEFDDVLVERQQKKVIRYYVKILSFSMIMALSKVSN